MASLQLVTTVSSNLQVINDSAHALCAKELTSSTQINASSDLLWAIPDLAHALPGVNAGVNVVGICNAEIATNAKAADKDKLVQQMVYAHHDEAKDSKVFMEAMMSEMRRVMRLELEQVHEQIDQMEGTRERQPQNVRNLHRREIVQPREVRVEDEEPYGVGFDEEDDRDSIIAQDFSSTS
ncbi:hypothetical protein F0562_006043 [Nyssa sinensis]|uniref:Uncharacterized protein n=1 Tax=Nyssa sinensis TaxID=561372 RepID=A0A5J5AM35_9ASTE|nr:hypothetical protein F0562_006043 [Nyssa sinensis]